MASATMPLLGEVPQINLTTRQSPPNFSKPFGSLRSSAAPHLTLHDFRKLQHLPSHNSSPDIDYKRVRRKPSRLDLSARPFVVSTGEASVARGTPLRQPSLSQSFLPSPQSSLPSTPRDYTTAISPSLTSTVSTIQSSPTQTPVPPGSSVFEQWSSGEDIGLREPIRHKRKFPSIKQAKRLPRRVGGDWYVYAAVIDHDGGDLGGHGKGATVHVTEAREASKAESGAQARPKGNFGSRRGRSVRFAGIDSGSSSSAEHTESGEEKEPTAADSSYTLSNFKFPTPPGYAWAGTFGHLGRPTPPTSPATLHYRGASFDVVNPHASLLLGTQKFETPAEIDGLLDDYFNRTADSLPMPYDDLTGEMSSSQHSAPPASDGSRRGRELFPDPETARRNIMRIPSANSNSNTPETVYQESPLARRGQDTGLPLSTAELRDLEDGHGAPFHHDSAGAGQPGQHVQTERGSSQYPPSLRSDPFDLHVSDDEENFNNIDELLAAGRGTQYLNDDEVHYESGGGFAAYDEGVYAQADAPQQNRDTTIGDIVDAYNHSGMLFAGDDNANMSSTERGRDISQMDEGSNVVSMDSFVTNPFGDSPDKPQTMASARPTGPPSMPAPPPPARLQYYTDCSDLPNTDQTYGVTGDLLRMTPAHKDSGPSYPWPTGGTQMPVGGYVYTPTNYHNQENALPESDGSPVVFTATADIPATWSNADITGRHRMSHHDRGLSGQPFIRSSSRYTQNDGGWEDTQASDTRPNLAALASRPSGDSYADVSDYDSNHRLSQPAAPQAQPVTTGMVGGNGSPYIRVGCEAYRMLKGGSNEPNTDDPVQRAKQLLKANMMENQLMGSQANSSASGGPQVISKEQLRRNEAELEDIRKKHPAAIKTAVDQIANETENSLVPLRRDYDPNNSFEKVIRLGLQGDGQSFTSSRRGVRHPGTESPGLVFSDTMNTFRTTPRGAPPMPGFAAENWSPLMGQPLAVMTPGGRTLLTPSTQRTGERDDYEMNSMRRFGDSRPAISSQTSLLPLHLRNRSTTPYGERRPMTDAELRERGPNWSMDPTGRSVTQTDVAFAIGTILEPAIETVEGPALLTVAQGRQPQMLREQKMISRKYFSRSMWCPITAMLFGLGYMDGKARADSQGRVTEMSKDEKYWALFYAAPLGSIAYAIVVVVIVISVVASRA